MQRADGSAGMLLGVTNGEVGEGRVVCVVIPAIRRAVQAVDYRKPLVEGEDISCR
jgi:hypothetical protein